MNFSLDYVHIKYFSQTVKVFIFYSVTSYIFLLHKFFTFTALVSLILKLQNIISKPYNLY